MTETESSSLRLPRRRLLLALAGAAGGLAGCATPPTLPGFEGLVRQAAPGVVGLGDERGMLGSGFRLAGTRVFVTARHVVAAVRGAPVVVWETWRSAARVLREDAELDLALLEVPEGDLPMPGLSLWAGAAPAPGEWVLVLGRPFGGLPTATVGIVSAAPGAVQEPTALRTRLQLNAAVNPGNSGGPVLNLAGQVLGVVSATIPGGFGIGFAVPAAAVEAFARAPR